MEDINIYKNYEYATENGRIEKFIYDFTENLLRDNAMERVK